MRTSLAQNHQESNAAPMAPIAARPEEFNLLALRPTPLADLLPPPEALEAAFPNASREPAAFPPCKPGRSDRHEAGINAAAPNHGPCKLVEFYLAAPFASLVRLAADFTDWEQSPLDMIKSEDGVWSIFVPLRPGKYAYHFIVDGERREDPHPVPHGADLGVTNAVVKVS